MMRPARSEGEGLVGADLNDRPNARTVAPDAEVREAGAAGGPGGVLRRSVTRRRGEVQGLGCRELSVASEGV